MHRERGVCKLAERQSAPHPARGACVRLRLCVAAARSAFPPTFAFASHPSRDCAQARALQLWVAANRSGQIRVYTNTSGAADTLQYSMVAPKPGVAACTLLCWLLELR